MSDDYDLIGVPAAAEESYGVQLPGGAILQTHGPALCKDDPACCIHKPSDHPLNRAPMNWRADRGLMERMCPHGIGHPDPDDIAHKRRTQGEQYASGQAVHGCDGCCRA